MPIARMRMVTTANRGSRRSPRMAWITSRNSASVGLITSPEWRLSYCREWVLYAGLPKDREPGRPGAIAFRNQIDRDGLTPEC